MPGIVPGAWDLGGDVVNSSSLFSANVARSSSIVTDGYPPGWEFSCGWCNSLCSRSYARGWLGYDHWQGIMAYCVALVPWNSSARQTLLELWGSSTEERVRH